MQHEVILSVGGAQYAGWKGIAIQRSIEQISGTFDLTVTERWPARSVTARPIRPGESCAVAIDSTTVITGYVDDVEPHYSADSHEVTVRGRDRTADLVDCSAEHGSGQFDGQTLLQIAQAVCAPHGVNVRAETDIGKAFATASIQEGETVFELLERLARHRGVLLVSDARGGLVITRAGTARIGVTLRGGSHVLEARARISHRDRYARYVVKGQSQGGDTAFGTVVTGPTATRLDNAVRSNRVLVVVAEDQVDSAGAAERAVWERNVRAGRSSRVSISVQGWYARPGTLWTPNVRVRVQDTWLGVDAELLVSSVSYVLDDRGTRSELELVLPDAFDVRAVPELASASPSWGTAAAAGGA